MTRGAQIASLPPDLPAQDFQYGMQAHEVWTPGQTDERPLFDISPAKELWRVSIVGDLSLRVFWGTSSRSEVVTDAPLVGTFPGNVQIYGSPRSSELGASGRVSATRASAAGPFGVRRVVSGPGFALSDEAVRFVALVASTVTIRGTAVAVPVLSSVPLVSGSVLTAGTGYVEFEP